MVAEIEQLVQLKAHVTDRIFLHVDLQPSAFLLQVAEPCLAHQPDRHDAPGHTHVHARVLQLLGSLLRVLRQNLRDGVGELVLVAVRGLPERLDLFQLLAP